MQVGSQTCVLLFGFFLILSDLKFIPIPFLFQKTIWHLAFCLTCYFVNDNQSEMSNKSMLIFVYPFVCLFVCLSFLLYIVYSRHAWVFIFYCLCICLFVCYFSLPLHIEGMLECFFFIIVYAFVCLLVCLFVISLLHCI